MIILGFLLLIILLHYREMCNDFKTSIEAMKTSIMKAEEAIPTQADAVEAMSVYAQAQANLEKIESQKKLELLKVEQKYAGAINDFTEQRDACGDIIIRYAQANRDSLFTDKKRSTAIGVGTVGVKLNPPKLVLAEGYSWEAALNKVKTTWLGEYVRVTEEIDKKAILQDFKNVTDESDLNDLAQAGLVIQQDEQVYIKL